MLQVYRDTINTLKYNLDNEIASYKQALIAHSTTINVPAPITYPLVELIVKFHNGQYQIIEPETGVTPTDPESWANKVIDIDTKINNFISPPDTPRTLALKSDAGRANLLSLLQTATPNQIDNWLANNVTTLVQARNVLGLIIKLIATNLPTS